MTNSTSSNTKTNNSNSLKTQAVFDVDGKELVYMNDNFFGRVKVYLEGDEI